MRRLRESAHPGVVFLRFGTLSLLTAVLDNTVFYLLFRGTGLIAASQIGARCVSLMFNYWMAGRAVFCTGHRHGIALPKYLLLAFANLVASYAGIRLLTSVTPLSVVASKITAETLLFAANFTIQKTFIFRRTEAH